MNDIHDKSMWTIPNCASVYFPICAAPIEKHVARPALFLQGGSLFSSDFQLYGLLEFRSGLSVSVVH